MRIAFLLAGSWLAVSLAGAATVNLTSDSLVASGWKATTTFVYGGTTDASVTQTEDYGIGNFRFDVGPMPRAWEFQWAGISSNAFAGTPLASITSIRIRNLGLSGDNPASWQPPTFGLVVDRGDTNQRCITWIPWANGNAREAGVWHEYDAAITGQWLVHETGVYHNSLAALKAALPNAYLEYPAELPLDWGYASQHAFNVGFTPFYDGDRARFTNTTGYVDWFEVGINSNVTRYELGVVPEPALLSVLAAALAMVGLRRRTER